MQLAAVGTAKAQFRDPAITDQIPTVVYVSEVPYQLSGELGNPLELWARKLSSGWAAIYSTADSKVTKLKPELSWERLEKTARTGRADAYVVHGYEFEEHSQPANLVPLLVPYLHNRAAMVEFVILRRRPEESEAADRPFRMLDLERKKVRVDRAGCGELVYRWLDCEILPETGDARREYLADFYSAASAAEAVLDVYFGQMDACVVSREDYLNVLRYNRSGISRRLEEVRISPQLLKYVIAGSGDPQAAVRRKDLQDRAVGFSLVLGKQKFTLGRPHPDDMKNLRALISKWNSYFGKRDPAESAGPEDPLTESPSAPPRITERRDP